MSIAGPIGRPRPGTAGVPRLEEVVVLGLAAARLTRAVSLDEISARPRHGLAARAEHGGAAARWANALVSCPLCVGWWISLGVSVAAPGRHRLLRGASVAGMQTVLALVERLVSEQGRAAIHEADAVEERASGHTA